MLGLDNDRYSRQVRFDGIGVAGQERIAASRIVVIGAGALGSVVAELLTRAGVGYLRIIDRDFVELSNLQRQSLYDEADVQHNLPKAVAAAAKLKRINSSIVIDGIVDDVNPATVEDYIRDVDLVLDGLDNFETRFVVNDACAKHRRSWIYAAAVGSYGLVMPVVPGKSPCLRCMLGSLPAPGSSPTCDTAGVIGPITHLIASIQAAEALKLICGSADVKAVKDLALIRADVWSGSYHRSALDVGAMKVCALCAEGRLDYLHGNPLRTVTLCGRNAVQLIPSVKGNMNFEALSRGFASDSQCQFNEFLMKCVTPPYELTLFKDGRAIIKGTEDPALARSVYAKLVGA